MRASRRTFGKAEIYFGESSRSYQYKEIVRHATIFSVGSNPETLLFFS